MTEAYYREGEPLYDKMVVLFGFEYVKTEKSISIVEISEDENVNKDDGEASDEVTSPPILPRRRLFHDSGMSTEFTSTRPPKLPGRGGKFLSKNPAQTSSTGSSPLMWWKP